MFSAQPGCILSHLSYSHSRLIYFFSNFSGLKVPYLFGCLCIFFFPLYFLNLWRLIFSGWFIYFVDFLVLLVQRCFNNCGIMNGNLGLIRINLKCWVFSFIVCLYACLLSLFLMLFCLLWTISYSRTYFRAVCSLNLLIMFFYFYLKILGFKFFAKWYLGSSWIALFFNFLYLEKGFINLTIIVERKFSIFWRRSFLEIRDHFFKRVNFFW